MAAEPCSNLAVSRTIKSIGDHDAETHEAACDNPDDPKPECQIPGGVVGDYIGAQMAAANIDPLFSINSLLPDNVVAGRPRPRRSALRRPRPERSRRSH